MTEKKSYVGDKKLRDWTKWQSTVFCEKRYSAFAIWFSFFVNKKNYKAKFSTNLILKKNWQIILEGKKSWEKTL
jgi:hypothetical protein